MVKSTHPFSSSKLPNSFYFLRTHPNRYDPVDYFRTFSGLKIRDKGRLHRCWGNVLQILLESPLQKYKDNGSRLQTAWSTPDKGLGTFWDELGQAETASEVLDASRENVRKRSLRSAERSILRAIDDIDNNTNGDDRIGKRQRVPASGKENTSVQPGSVDTHKTLHVKPQEIEVQAGEIQESVVYKDQSEATIQDEADDLRKDDITAQDRKEDANQEDSQSECEEPLSQKTTESECELSRSVFYPTGNGSVDCSEALWTPWLVNQQDLAPKLWRYRETIIANAQRLESLTGSTEKLVVSHIYFFEKNDSISSLFAAVGAHDWAAITSTTMRQMMDGAALLGLQTLAIEISHLTHAEAEERILDWTGPRDVKKTLAGLLADDFLWSRLPFNEHELLSHIFDPLIKSFICSVDSSTVQVDLEKLAMLMKDSIDDMHAQGVGAPRIEVIGLVVAGAEGRLYTMRLEARGIYAMRLLSVVYAPRSQYDLGVLASTINTFMNVRERLQRVISEISSDQSEVLDFSRPGFHTPTRVYKS
ncbi:hypothetical protein BGZ73_004022 [Actinomortierella ambigua]|nr:hypothetical protein BGZ73_004022 [Actinomortierella ambigua]